MPRGAFDDMVRIGSGFLVNPRRSGSFELDALGVDVELELEVEDGRLVVRELTARRRTGAPPVTIDVLRSIPVVGLVSRTATDGLLHGLLRARETKPGSYRVTEATREDLEELPELERVAVVYRAAYLFGLPPTVTVAEELGFSHAVAAKRVQAARREGLLEPTIKGKKGA